MGKYRNPKSKKAYKIITMISISSNATIFKAEFLSFNRNHVAIKAIKFTDDSVPPNFTNRDNSIFHRKLLHVYRLFLAERGCVWTIMPFFPNGSLHSIVPYFLPDGLSEQCIAAVLKQVLCALVYLHSRGKFHGDIKPGNIIISGPNSPVKLADFEISESNYDPMANSDKPYWKAPANEVGFKSDIWSIGVTALELAHGGPPLLPRLDLVPESLRLSIRKRFGWSLDCEERYKNVTVQKTLSEDFADMVASCLDQDPSKRPSANNLLNHPFFSKALDSSSLIRDMLEEIPSVEKRLNEFNLNMRDSARQSIECYTFYTKFVGGNNCTTLCLITCRSSIWS